MAEYKCGDVVRLICGGGPAMVVEAIDKDGWYVCVWFDDLGRVRERPFCELCLMSCDADPTTDEPDPDVPNADPDEEDFEGA